MNQIEKLMKLDRGKLAEIPTAEVEIKRLSELCGEPFIVKCKAVPGNKYAEIASYMTGKKGETVWEKTYKVATLLALEGVVEPDLKDKALQEHFGCKTPKDLAELLFFGSDMQDVANLITELSGYGKDEEEEIKN